MGFGTRLNMKASTFFVGLRLLRPHVAAVLGGEGPAATVIYFSMNARHY
jgi:hypothetical protein